MNDINYAVRDRAAWIEINRPEVRNAISLQTTREIAAAVELATADSEVRVLVVTGAGDRVFAAGADLNEAPTAYSSPASARDFDVKFDAGRIALEACPLPTVARMQGHAIGGGLSLALACDLRIASERIRVGYPVARIGLMLDPKGNQRLLNTIGPSKTKWLLFTGERLTARQAEAWGLVDRVVADDEFDEVIDQIIGDIVAGAPLSLRASKRLIDSLVRDGQADEALVEQCYEEIYSSADLQEGFAAVREKRSPVFWGK